MPYMDPIGYRFLRHAKLVYIYRSLDKSPLSLPRGGRFCFKLGGFWSVKNSEVAV